MNYLQVSQYVTRRRCRISRPTVTLAGYLLNHIQPVLYHQLAAKDNQMRIEFLQTQLCQLATSLAAPLQQPDSR